jgi:multiple sugar transport system substrate-binding protein
VSAMKLKGMTWSHPRGYDPMVACSKLWKEQTGIDIEWEKRSLQDFESFPVEELAREYDLIVIDHPHVGQITAENCLAPLDVPGREAEQHALSAGSVGQSYPSYHWQGRQWAFPIDTATQVCAWRPDLLEGSPASWDGVVSLARAGRVLLPLRPPHSLMTFYTLCGNLRSPCAIVGQLIGFESGIRTFEMMREIAALIDPACFEMDPIAALERMGEAGSQIACSPLIYGYVNYAIKGFPPRVMMVLPARHSAALASVFRLFQQITPRLSISLTGLREARCNEGRMRQRAGNRLMPTLGKTKPSMRQRQIFTQQRARRSKLPGCAHAIRGI